MIQSAGKTKKPAKTKTTPPKESEKEHKIRRVSSSGSSSSSFDEPPKKRARKESTSNEKSSKKTYFTRTSKEPLDEKKTYHLKKSKPELAKKQDLKALEPCSTEEDYKLQQAKAASLPQFTSPVEKTKEEIIPSNSYCALVACPTCKKPGILWCSTLCLHVMCGNCWNATMHSSCACPIIGCLEPVVSLKLLR